MYKVLRMEDLGLDFSWTPLVWDMYHVLLFVHIMGIKLVMMMSIIFNQLWVGNNFCEFLG